MNNKAPYTEKTGNGEFSIQQLTISDLIDIMLGLEYRIHQCKFNKQKFKKFAIDATEKTEAKKVYQENSNYFTNKTNRLTRLHHQVSKQLDTKRKLTDHSLSFKNSVTITTQRYNNHANNV